MLTVSQVQPAAYVHEGELYHRHCLTELLGGEDEDGEAPFSIVAAEQGYSNEDDVSVWIRYTLDEYIGERASEYADEEVGDYSDDPDAWQAAFDAYPDEEPCSHCGLPL